MNVQVIGVDCATDDKRVGLAVGRLTDDRLSVERALTCSREETARHLIVECIRASDLPTLLAIDAPLGWPRDMGRILGSHRAGALIDVDSNLFFRRQTDRFVKSLLGITPLDVGADRIARTAHAALRLLSELSQDLNKAVPLAWSLPLADTVSAVEVYPAGTLVAHGLRSRAYKKREHVEERLELLRELSELAVLPQDCSAMERSADALDAGICLLAAADFLRGLAMQPKNLSIAEVEGWIWVRAQL